MYNYSQLHEFPTMKLTLELFELYRSIELSSIEKKSVDKWSCEVQSCVVLGSVVFRL